MKKLIQLIFFVLLSACSSHVISFYVVDESDINYTTFSFYARDRQSKINQKVKLDSLIENVITGQLLKKGYTHTSPSDIYISYKIMSDKTYKNHNNNQYNPLSQNGLRYPTGFPPNYNNSLNNGYVTERKEGVLIVDLYNKNDKLIWQGSKAFKVRKSIDTKELLIQYGKEVISAYKSNL